MPLDVDAAPVRGVGFRHVPAGGSRSIAPGDPATAAPEILARVQRRNAEALPTRRRAVEAAAARLAGAAVA